MGRRGSTQGGALVLEVEEEGARQQVEAGEAGDEGFGGGSGEEKDSGEGEAPPVDASEREGDV